MGFFDFLKKSAEPAAPAAPAFPLVLAADAKGAVVPMEQIPDEVFAQARSTPSACRSASSGRAGSWASSPWSTCSSTSAASASPACTVSATSAADRQPRPSGGSGRTA